MNNLTTLLNDWKNGQLSAEELASKIINLSAKQDEFHIDYQRILRKGNNEIIFCESKTPTQTADIFYQMAQIHPRILGTRANLEHYEATKKKLGTKYLNFDSKSLLLKFTREDITLKGKVIVICAGTSDVKISEEAAQTAEFLGSKVIRHYDCGIAGIHRLFSIIPDFATAGAVIVAAGMDGALPSVVAGISSAPVIALPTSVGYGTGLGGIAALLTMLNGCAPGLSVVNIDNGFGAGYQANIINLRSKYA